MDFTKAIKTLGLNPDQIQDLNFEISSLPKKDRKKGEAIKAIVKEARKVRIPKSSTFTGSRQIVQWFQGIASEQQEYFYIVMLDNKNQVIDYNMISKGLINRTLVHPREVFAPALENRSVSLVVLHNHPSGETMPSIQDRKITKRLVEVGKLVGINILDHIILGSDEYFSFVDQGIMPVVED